MRVLQSCGLQPPIWTDFWKSQVWRPKCQGTEGIDIRLVPSVRSSWYGMQLERFAFPWPLHHTKECFHFLFILVCAYCALRGMLILNLWVLLCCRLLTALIIMSRFFRVKFTHHLKAGSSSICWALTTFINFYQVGFFDINKLFPCGGAVLP